MELQSGFTFSNLVALTCGETAWFTEIICISWPLGFPGYSHAQDQRAQRRTRRRGLCAAKVWGERLGCIINLADRREYYLLSSPYLTQNWQWEHKENPFTPWQIAFQILSLAGVILAACPRGTLTMLVFVRLKGKGYHGISCKHAGTWCRWQRSAASSVLESWWRWRMSITMSVWRHYDCWLLTND